jgi:hypothetical protein
MVKITSISFIPPSVKVSLQLVLDIEAFLFNDLPSILRINEEMIKDAYVISITEPNTELKFKTINEYRFKLFPKKQRR